MDKLITIIFSFAILGQAWGARAYIGTWLAPAPLWGMFWFMLTIIPLVALYDVPIDPTSVLYLLVVSIVFTLTSFNPYGWHWMHRRNREINRHYFFESRFITRVFFVLSTMAIICFLVDLSIQDVSLSEIFTNPLGVAAKMITKRYAEELVPNIFAKLSFVLQYPAAILGGIVNSKRRSAFGSFEVMALTFTPSILGMVLLGAKGTLFLAIAFYAGGRVVCKLSRGDMTLISRQELRRMMPYVLLVIVLLTLSMLSRFIGNPDAEIGAGLQRLFASYMMAHLYAFSDWFNATLSHYSIFGSQTFNDNTSGLGLYTFTPISRLLGNESILPQGTYDEYFIYGDLFQTNIYTMFRGLIIDFGLLGSIIYIAASGLVLHFAYAYFLCGKRPALSTAIVAHSVGYFYSSFMISLFTYSSIYASIMIVYAVLVANGYHSRRRERRKRRTQAYHSEVLSAS